MSSWILSKGAKAALVDRYDYTNEKWRHRHRCNPSRLHDARRTTDEGLQLAGKPIANLTPFPPSPQHQRATISLNAPEKPQPHIHGRPVRSTHKGTQSQSSPTRCNPLSKQVDTASVKSTTFESKNFECLLRIYFKRLTPT